MNNTRYHRFRIERDAPTQEQYGSIVVGIPIGVGDFDKGSISTAEESTVRRCLSIPEGGPVHHAAACTRSIPTIADPVCTALARGREY
jgi:hypothetical protein